MRIETSSGSDHSDHPVLAASDASDRQARMAPVATLAELANPDEPIRVLFLCTHNSARSQVAEAALRMQGGRRVQVFSAGSHPTSVHSMVAALLEEYGIDVSLHRSKSMDEFAGQSFDYVITLCDGARDLCPTFPGDPVRIHWSFPDPSIVEDEGARSQAFATLWLELNLRIGHLLNLPHPTSTRRGRPESLAGMAEVPGLPEPPRPRGMTGKPSTFSQKLHLRHGE
jgi:protein-tyrosine-phosphatase